MDRASVLQIYDDQYAAVYNECFLLGDDFRECTSYESSLLRSQIDESTSWLDVACGTGYFLSLFPRIVRCGLDIAPAMLKLARTANPGAHFVEGDYRSDFPEWRDQWSLVSCMWYAYSYAGSIWDVERVFGNLAAWTAPGGSCFVPLCDPDVLAKTQIPHRPPADSTDGELEVTAIIWNWTDLPFGKQHKGLIAPHTEHILGIFRPLFSDVSVHVYPAFERDCLTSRKAILAKGKLA